MFERTRNLAEYNNGKLRGTVIQLLGRLDRWTSLDDSVYTIQGTQLVKSGRIYSH